MYHSKLLDIYRKLSAGEVRNFKKFVFSPYFNQHEDVSKLFQFLFSKKYLSENNTDRHKLFQALYGTEKFDDARLRYIASLSVEVLIQFLQTEQNAKDEVAGWLAVSKIFAEKKLENYSIQFIEKSKAVLENKPMRNAYYWQQHLTLEEEIFKHAAQQSRTKENNIADILQNIDQYYITQSLKYACVAISYQQISKVAYTQPFLDFVLQNIEADESLLNASSMVYYFIYQMYTHSDAGYFDKLLHLLPTHSSYFAHDEIKDVYLLLINFGIKQLNSGDKKYALKLYEIYKSGLASNIFIENNQISRFTFTNIVFTGLQSGDFKGVHQFINQHEKYLPEQYKTSTVAFNKARYHYMLKAYNKALQYLTDFEYNDVLQNLAVKNMQLKIYVETKNWQVLDAFLHTFSIYLHRQKGLGYHLVNYKNTIRYAKQIQEISLSTKKVKEQFKQEIRDEKNLLDKDWFLEIIK